MENETIKTTETQEIQDYEQENELDLLLRLIRTSDATHQQRNQIFKALENYILSR